MNNGHTETRSPNYRHPALAAITGGETTLRRTLRVIRRRQWVFFLVAGGVFTLAAIYAFTRPMSYVSHAAVEVGPGTPVSPSDLIGEGRTPGSTPPWEHHFKTQENLLHREGLMKQVLDSFKDRPGVVSEFLDSPDPVRKLSRRVTVKGVPSTFIIEVALDHEEPDHGPEIVSRLIDLYILESNKRLQDQILGVLYDLEKKTLPEFHDRVMTAEQRYQEFLATTGAGDLAERHGSLVEHQRRIATRIFDLRMRKWDLLMDPTRRGFEFEDEDSFLGSPRLIERLWEERHRLEAEVAKLSGVLLDKHPVMIGLHRQIAAINTRLKEAHGIFEKNRDRIDQTAAERLEKEMTGADEALKALLTDESDVKVAIAAASTQLAERAKLEGELAAAKDIYNTYLKRQAAVKAMAGAGVASVRVVEKASTPLGKQKETQLILTLGAILGLLFGAASVVIAEQNDDRASTPYEAEAAVGLDVLVSVPKMSKPLLGSRAPVIPKDHPLRSPLEPFRRLRLEVAARLHQIEGSRVVAVVGAGFNEGKSTVAINLARVLGLEKRKVLLVDGEFRRPRLKALLGDAKAPGLEEFIRSDAHFRDVVQTTKMPNVDVLGASKPMDEAPELPSTQRFRDLWTKARSFYDYIIVDSGPVNAFSEAAGVTTNADAAILIMDERRSRLRDVVSARRILENLEVRILGLVVNRSLNPAAGGLVSRLIAEARAQGNGHAAPVAAAPMVFAGPAHAPGEDPALKQVLDRLFVEMDTTKQRASVLEQEKSSLSQRELELRKSFEEIERDHNQRLEGELRKNADLAQKFTAFVETSRTHEEEQLKKLEVIFTKSLEGVNKKLTDLRLRSFAGGGGGGGGGMEGDVVLRPSQATIDGIFSQKIESNLGAMDKPDAKKAAGGVSNALDRLKNMRSNTPSKKDEEKK